MTRLVGGSRVVNRRTLCRLRGAAGLMAGALGYAALLARPTAVAGALLVDAAVGIIGVVAPVPSTDEQPIRWTRWIATTAIGVMAFVAGRLLGPRHLLHVAIPGPAIASVVVASVAEEAFFRRWVYAWLAVRGPAFAVAGSAAAFAIVHLSAYGPRALPIDVAAGLLFGWQRAATGGWTAPAVTHLAANLLQLG